MTAGEWAVLLVGVAAVLAALAAVLKGRYRRGAVVGAVVLIAAAGLVAGLSAVRDAGKPSFAIDEPSQNEVVDMKPTVLRGTISDVEGDAVYVVEETVDGGHRVWLVVGEAIVSDGKWTFDYVPHGPAGQRLTLALVRATRDCDRQLRALGPDAEGRRIVRDPPLGGCEVLGLVSVYPRD